MIRTLLAGVAAMGAAAGAVPVLDPMVTDHAVLQRDRPIHVRGVAEPGERVTVRLAGQSRILRADQRGQWTATFAAMEAGGPYRLEARGADGPAAIANDLMIGDVWLCSGQSNMEWPLRKTLNGEGEVASASDTQLRLMKVPQNRQLAPQPFLARDVAWKHTTPDSAKDFSAACYFMARALRQSHGVAVGAIDSTWGGTAIASWMDEASVRSTGGEADVDLLRAYRADPEGTVQTFGARWATWWRQRSGDRPGSEPWNASDRLAWRAMPKIDFWENWGDPAFRDWNGAIWARARINLTAEEAEEGGTLSLGAIDDFDRSFVNGEPVGTTLMYNRPRHYPVTASALRPGENEVVVFILDDGGAGGFWGPAEQLKLTLANGTVKLLRGWEYSAVPTAIGTPPLPPWDERPGVTTLYNGMIAPLGPIGLRGTAWYQGEADAGKQNYDARLAAMMKAWRGQFGDARLPFLIVGLAGFGSPAMAPTESSWAIIRDEQRRAAASDDAAALVSAVDIGERHDIHPPNKQEVGRRLALAAEMLAYGNAKGALAPEPLEAKRTEGSIVVRFDKPVVSYGGSPMGLELCSEHQESCRYVQGHIEGSAIVLADDGKPATRIRYAWSESPIVNLYGAEMLPVPPFELPVDE